MTERYTPFDLFKDVTYPTDKELKRRPCPKVKVEVKPVPAPKPPEPKK